MPYKNKNRGSDKKPERIDVLVVQWLNKETDRYQKIERATGAVISEKVTPGPYKNFHVVTRRPRRRTIKPAAKKGTRTQKQVKDAVKKTKKVSTKKKAEKKAPVKKKPKKVNYLNNKDLLAEVLLSKSRQQMTDKLAHMLQTLCSRYGRRGNFANYCVDSKTEALTTRGWKKYDEISLSDRILSYNPDTETLVWSAIKELYINNNYCGPMHRLNTQGMDALVTPNHKFVSRERGIVPVEDIICNEHIVLTGQHVKDTNAPMYSNAFVQAVGWAVTEGHYIQGSVKKRCITISQKEGYRADQIRACLTESDIPYKEYSWKKDLIVFNCVGDDISQIYDTIAPERVLSENFILSLTQEQRLLLIETMVAGDGWYRPTGGMSYVQKDKQHVDAFLMLCTVAGLTTSTTQREYPTPISNVNPNGGVSNVYSINIYTKPKLVCKAECINFHGGRAAQGGRRNQKTNTPTEHYEGTIWCPQTEFGTFVCRRNKYIHVTGNTYNEDMQAYAMMMLVRTWNSFNPEKSNNPFAFFTQCVKNSFIQFLNSEKRHRNLRDELMVNEGLNPSYSYQLDHEAKNEEKRLELHENKVEAPAREEKNDEELVEY